MSLGSKIRRARKAKGLTQEDVARHFGIRAPSVSGWEADDTRPEFDRLPPLAALLGVGVEWLMAQGDDPLPADHDSAGLAPATRSRLRDRSASQVGAPQFSEGGVKSNVGARPLAPYAGEQPRDLPVRGTAICGEQERGDFRLNGETVDYLRRPPRLNGVEGAFAVYLIDESMAPQFAHGDPAFIHPGQPVVPGDTVLVELHPDQEGETHGPAMVKVLVRRTATKLRLMQHNPKLDIEIDIKRVKNLYRVIPYRELFEI